MDTTLTFIINNALADQLLSDPKELKTFESHCEDVTAKLSLHEFKTLIMPGVWSTRLIMFEKGGKLRLFPLCNSLIRLSPVERLFGIVKISKICYF